MKKQITMLYVMVPVVLLLGWVSVRDDEGLFIRGYAVEIAVALAISAVVLTVGNLVGNLVTAAKFLRVGAVCYIVFTIFRLVYDFDWADFR